MYKLYFPYTLSNFYWGFKLFYTTLQHMIRKEQSAQLEYNSCIFDWQYYKKGAKKKKKKKPKKKKKKNKK